MKLTELKLKNYRNCKDICLKFTGQIALIIGKNAQGKTNILESIYFLSGLKSPRTSVLTDLININAEKMEISAEILKDNIVIDFDLTYNRQKTRELRLNKLKTTPKNFKNKLKAVLFSTKDLFLLRGTPQDRRDWLDRAISQIYPAYDERLLVYDKIKIQKNNLLKSDNIDKSLLEVYNEQLVITGANIIFVRKKFLHEIEKIASEKHKSISSTEVFSLEYSEKGTSIEEITKFLREELQQRYNEELARKQTCVGPHRDDINFKINNLDAIKFASQGQQRTLVLALKLAELDIIKEKTGMTPILLLDDVLAELDDVRQLYLLKSVGNNVQTIITSVDTLLFDENFLKNVEIFSVTNGEIRA